MKPEPQVLPPEPPIPDVLQAGARTLIRNGLMQNNLDANFHQIENLDISNIHFPGPPTQTAPVHKWFNSYNAVTYLFGSTQPAFADISGALTHLQKIAIDELGTITAGIWHGSIILGDKLDTLDRIRGPLANVNLGLKRIVNLADPLDPQDACTLHTAHQLSGRNPKQAVRCVATTSHQVSGTTPIDGVPITEGDRVLLTAQGRAWENGIWIVHGVPSLEPDIPEIIWTRPADFDNSPVTVPEGMEIDDAQVFVLEGTTHAGTTWFQDVDAPIYITERPPPRPGEPPIPYPHFILINTSLDVSTGPGLAMSGRAIYAVGTPNRIDIGTGIDISATYAGQSTITKLGIVAQGTWRATLIDGKYGGTGHDNTGKQVILLGNFTTTGTADPTYPGVPDAPAGTPLTFKLRGPTNLLLPQIGDLVSTDQPQTLTNKRITKRVVSVSNANKPNINIDTTDVYRLTGQTSTIDSFTEGLTGTPTDGQELEIFVQEPPPVVPGDSPLERTITWGPAYTDSLGMPLPENTVGLGGFYTKFVFSQQLGLWVLTQHIDTINVDQGAPP